MRPERRSDSAQVEPPTNAATRPGLKYGAAPMPRHNHSDQFSKNILRDALSRASTSETEVEVLAATQRIDVYAVPDPARAAERGQMGLLGWLSEEPSVFEPFRNTPSLVRVRQCLRKQLTWHHE